MDRISVVGRTKILNVSNASIFHVGDSVEMKPKAKVLAVQREVSSFLGDEGSFKAYRIFSQPIPEVEATEKVAMDVRNPNRWIKVSRVSVMSVTASSIFQIGSSNELDTEARVKHIRQLLKGTQPR